jgi:hypothetical protein
VLEARSRIDDAAEPLERCAEPFEPCADPFEPRAELLRFAPPCARPRVRPALLCVLRAEELDLLLRLEAPEPDFERLLVRTACSAAARLPLPLPLPLELALEPVPAVCFLLCPVDFERCVAVAITFLPSARGIPLGSSRITV